jgi:hypothetical protein
MRLKGRTRPSEAWIVTKSLKVGPLLIFYISLAADYKAADWRLAAYYLAMLTM